MDRINSPGATADHMFTEGNPVAGVPATTVSAAWLNDLQEELIAIIVAGGITPEQGIQNQVLTAIQELISSGASATATETSAGVVRLATALESQGWVHPDAVLTVARLVSAYQGANQNLASLSGFQRYPGGLVEMWGQVTLSGAGTGTFTYPLTVSSVLAVTPTVVFGGTYYGVSVDSTPGLSSCNLRASSAVPVNVTVRILGRF